MKCFNSVACIAFKVYHDVKGNITEDELRFGLISRLNSLMYDKEEGDLPFTNAVSDDIVDTQDSEYLDTIYEANGKELFNVNTLFHFELGQLVYYMRVDRICSSKIVGRRYLDGNHGTSDGCIPPQGAFYETSHGTFAAGKVFISKEDLVKDLLA